MLAQLNLEGWLSGNISIRSLWKCIAIRTIPYGYDRSMIASLFVFFFALWLLLLPGSAAALPQSRTPKPYQLLTPPLDTPWTSKVGTNPWPQHPRPLLYREAWQTLNGIWTYQPASSSSSSRSSQNATGPPPALPLAEEVLIPSCIESGISGIMASGGLMHMWFGTPFSVPADWPRKHRVLLNFEAVDYEATVFVNGKQVGFNRGGYFRFTLDVTEQVKFGEVNEL